MKTDDVAEGKAFVIGGRNDNAEKPLLVLWKEVKLYAGDDVGEGGVHDFRRPKEVLR